MEMEWKWHERGGRRGRSRTNSHRKQELSCRASELEEQKMEGRKKGDERKGVDRRGFVGEATKRGGISRWRMADEDLVKKSAQLAREGMKGAVKDPLGTC